MRIVIIRNTVACGRAVEVGDILEVEPREGRELIGLRKAAPAPPIQPVAFETAVIEDAEVAIESKPKAKRKYRRKSK